MKKEKNGNLEKNQFWTKTKIIFVLVFIAGFAMGIILSWQFIFPILNATTTADLNSLQNQKAELNKALDNCQSCLNKHNINPISCRKIS